MYAITFIEPWATLIRLGVKSIETRTWAPPSRDLLDTRIAIHAGKKLERNPGPVIERVLAERLGPNWRKELPLGQVVATARLAGWVRVRDFEPVAGLALHHPYSEVGCTQGRGSTPVDPWGDFRPSRWLWFLADVRPLDRPVAARGYQGFWKWDESGLGDRN